MNSRSCNPPNTHRCSNSTYSKLLSTPLSSSGVFWSQWMWPPSTQLTEPVASSLLSPSAFIKWPITVDFTSPSSVTPKKGPNPSRCHCRLWYHQKISVEIMPRPNHLERILLRAILPQTAPDLPSPPRVTPARPRSLNANKNGTKVKECR